MALRLGFRLNQTLPCDSFGCHAGSGRSLVRHWCYAETDNAIVASSGLLSVIA